ncbi:Conserved_hypothetical protein [Hexamita inflata]|uniref:Uncharacterized protein n=1 Tax=Hexamita inflata TaxID=28002 RepID=A0AA86U091_9EUKA|nr:Conserved hypothetical protein [Hexamita inflata]
MPPKPADKKDKKKVKLPFKFLDDKNNELEPEPYFLYLEKKYKAISKTAEVVPSPEFVTLIRSVFNSEDKSKQGVPFSQCTFTSASNPKQITLALKILEIYEPIQRISFTECEINTDVIKQLNIVLQKQKLIKFIAFAATKVAEQDLIQLLQVIPQSSVKTIKLENEVFGEAFLTQLGIMINKYVQLTKQKARSAIDEAQAKYAEEQEKLLNSKKKKKKSKKSKKGGDIYLMEVDDLYPTYFFLESFVFRYCKISPLVAHNLGKMVEIASQYLTQIDLRGNEFGAVGLGEIGAGLERCGLKLINKKVKGEIPLQTEVYTGSKFVKLQNLDLSNCLIQEDFPTAYKAFGSGIRYCGNLQEINLLGNECAKYLNYLNPSFMLQKQLVKVQLPINADPELEKELVTQLKEHRKKQAEVVKTMKKLAKEAKKAAKLAKKEKKAQMDAAKAAGGEKKGGDADLMTVETVV